MASFRPEDMTTDERLACRQLAAGDGPIAVYARMALALSSKRGVRLEWKDVWDLLIADESSYRALSGAVGKVLDGEAS